MAWSEASHLSRKNATREPSDLAVAMVSTAQQNIVAAQSIIPGDDTAWGYSSTLEIPPIDIRPLDSRTLLSRCGNA